jgi:hypothetical protein
MADATRRGHLFGTIRVGRRVRESTRPAVISEDHRMDKKAKNPKKPKQTKTKDGAGKK